MEPPFYAATFHAPPDDGPPPPPPFTFQYRVGDDLGDDGWTPFPDQPRIIDREVRGTFVAPEGGTYRFRVSDGSALREARWPSILRAGDVLHFHGSVYEEVAP